MDSLRSRLVLSHILPVLVVIPLIGLAIYLLLLTQRNLTSMEALVDRHTESLTEQAELLAETVGQVEEIWGDPAFAQGFITGIDLELTSIVLYDAAGNVLAGEGANSRPLEDILSSDELGIVFSGQQTTTLRIRDDAAARVAEIIIPVFDVNNRLTGALHLSHELTSAQLRFRNLTYILLGVTVLLLFFGVGVGLWLALRLERSLTQVTAALYDIATGQQPEALPHQNIIEFNQLYAAVNTLVERLSSLEDARRRLLANLVHELARPLGSMHAAIQALEQGAADDPALRHELLTGVNHQIERMQPLLDDLTELHGQVLGSLELHREPTPLSSWLQELAALWREAARQKGILWRADIPLDLPILAIDPDQMSRAVGNLLSNAVKFTPSGGTVTLSATHQSEATPPSVRICVADNGPGIDPTDQARIFEPFKRGEANRRFPQGMGLGLTIARDIVHAHGGEIIVASQPDAGAEFAIVLPID
jgi:two-component system sensor histidine kinase BaeS